MEIRSNPILVGRLGQRPHKIHGAESDKRLDRRGGDFHNGRLRCHGVPLCGGQRHGFHARANPGFGIGLNDLALNSASHLLTDNQGLAN
jgi:hypothetical protein